MVEAFFWYSSVVFRWLERVRLKQLCLRNKACTDFDNQGGSILSLEFILSPLYPRPVIIYERPHALLPQGFGSALLYAWQLFLLLSTWLVPYLSDLSSDVTSSGRPSLNTSGRAPVGLHQHASVFPSLHLVYLQLSYSMSLLIYCLSSSTRKWALWEQGDYIFFVHCCIPKQLAQYLELCVSRSVRSDSFNSMNCSLSGSSVHGILQARILEWAVNSFSRGSSQPRYWIRVSCIAGKFFTIWATREVHSRCLVKSTK